MRGDVDYLISTGGDRGVLTTLHKMADTGIPILGIYDSEEGGFLAEAKLEDLDELIRRLMNGDVNVEEATRISVKVDGVELPPALNEVAVFPYRSATLLRYLLKVDEEVVWRDTSDGVVISTPTGSTAYAMSAGGPLVYWKAPVFAIVSVNSLDITRRPIIIPDTSKIALDEVSSRFRSEVVIDGTLRSKVVETIEATKSQHPAKLIRFPKESPSLQRMTKKARLTGDLSALPPSAKFILKTLENEGPMTHQELSRKTLLQERTIRMALSLLIKRGLVKRQSILRDVRRKLYSVM